MLLRWMMLMVLHQYACAYNLDLRYPLVHTSNSTNDYFGFSVAIHPGSKNMPGDIPWMMVGAPHSNNTEQQFRQFDQPGLVYKCPLQNPTECKIMKLKQKFENDDNFIGNMLGSAQDILNGELVTCAPRWMKQATHRNHLFGECFVGSAKFTNNKLLNIQPLKTSESLTYSIQQGNARVDVHPFYVYGEAGFAAHFAETNNVNGQADLVLGAPGVFNWFGSTILYKGFSANPIVINPYLTHQDMSSFALFGYALSSGTYFEKNQILHVAGAPRSEQTGRVIVYTFPRETRGKMNTKDILSGQQVGEYFGSSLASCDINGDGLDELFVGAPFYSTNQDEGRVYVFYGTSAKKFPEASSAQPINGKVFNSRFGSTISCVGDLDRDGSPEIAIGAPYEKGGVVYVYKVSHDRKWILSQRIEAPSGAEGFGISISRGLDIDYNGYNDFAIGSYLSGHAFVFRTRPVVTLNARLQPKVDVGGLARNSSQFQVEECIFYTGHELPHTLEIIRKIEVDTTVKRVFIDGSSTQQSLTEPVTLKQGPGQAHCSDLHFTLKALNRNYLPIKVQTTYTLQEVNSIASSTNGDETLNGDDKFCSKCPILKNNVTMIEASTEIIFATQCKNNNICNSQISVQLDLLRYSSEFTVGSAPTIPLKVTVKNAPNVDPAYNTRVQLTLPLRAAKVPLNCKEYNDVDKTDLNCEVDDPLEQGSERILYVELDMHSKFTTKNELDFFANATTSSFDQEKRDNTMKAKLKLSSKADVSVSGSSKEETYLFDTKDNKELSSKKFVPIILRYQVERFGISPVHKVELIVNYPTATSSGRKFLQLTEAPKFKINAIPQKCDSVKDVEKVRGKREVETAGSTNKQPLIQSESLPSNRTLYVNCTSGNWECSQVHCTTGPFVNNQSIATLEIAMIIDSTVFEKELGLRDYILYGTFAQVKILDPDDLDQGANEKPDEVTVSATLRGRIPEGRVETWVLALSVIGGILLLMLLITGLIKAGFFKRKEKDALIKLKRETQLDLAALQRMHEMEDQDEVEGMDDSMEGYH